MQYNLDEENTCNIIKNNAPVPMHYKNITIIP